MYSQLHNAATGAPAPGSAADGVEADPVTDHRTQTAARSNSDDVVHGFDGELRVDAEAVVEHVDSNHYDSLAFMASLSLDRLVDRAELSRLDPAGLEFTAGTDTGRLDFDGAIASMSDLQAQVFGFIARARAAFPDAPLTSIETELQTTQELVTHTGHVVRTIRLTPTMVEVTLGGLDGFPIVGGDEFIQVMVGSPERPLAVGAGLPFSAVQSLPDDEQPVAATYTTRRRRPDAGELDVWVMLHGHDGGVAGWAEAATAGTPVALWGPRRAYHPPEATAAHVLVADETGVPACWAIAESLPTGHPVRAVVLVGDADQELPAPEGVEVTWLHRTTTDDPTAAMVDATRAALEGLENVFVFGASESRQITAVRRMCRKELGLDAERVHLTGYWRA